MAAASGAPVRDRISVARVIVPLVVGVMREVGAGPFSFCTQSTAMLSALVAILKPTLGFVTVCCGIDTSAQLAEIWLVTSIQVVPPSVVI